MTLSRAVVASAAAITLSTSLTLTSLAAGPAGAGRGGSGHHADRHPTVRFQKGAGVFWPVPSDPLSRLTGEYPFPSSDHRTVWVDLRV